MYWIVVIWVIRIVLQTRTTLSPKHPSLVGGCGWNCLGLTLDPAVLIQKKKQLYRSPKIEYHQILLTWPLELSSTVLEVSGKSPVPSLLQPVGALLTLLPQGHIHIGQQLCVLLKRELAMCVIFKCRQHRIMCGQIILPLIPSVTL
jgi:hypothetical protein